ncbi:hypothetical protein CW731_10285 [Polaribacter sp. ALD11]|uniref:hypothetical protein n=1 Tax=Polaribacter sp. ALD11 TaxID=2058137 RepID=UPI000C311EB3|nr:hypothetical protein [Polaribacter sp. ALD11]AUC85649.1 hypothetical protein CW731_10285 [Polaribacter sp. ALD11]
MKNLILIYTFLSVTLVTGIKMIDSNFKEFNHTCEENKIIATFDGAEGNYFFFTDLQGNAVQFESIEPNVQKKYDLATGNHVGEVFDITYNQTKILSIKDVNK